MTNFAGDEAWSSFVGVTADDLARALSAPPEPGPGTVRTLNDMTDEEISELQTQYNCPISSSARIRRGGKWGR